MWRVGFARTALVPHRRSSLLRIVGFCEQLSYGVGNAWSDAISTCGLTNLVRSGSAVVVLGIIFICGEEKVWGRRMDNGERPT